jgi:hypothetical protein
MALHDDIQYVIWKMYFKLHVCGEIKNSYKSLWYNKTPSLRLIELTSEDPGIYQHGNNELCEFVEDHEISAFNDIHKSGCMNCEYYNFPCRNCHEYLFGKQIPREVWKYTII